MTPVVALKVDPREKSPVVTDCEAANVLAVDSNGTLVVSRLSVTSPATPPPVRAVPAVTPVIVPAPVPGKVWPAAKLMVPFGLMKRPVSAAAAMPLVESRFNVAFGVAVLLPVGSAFHRKEGFTGAAVEES